ncbi:MAG TPA: riboflavin biosynthesis protein RibF [Terriglobales bacterium]|jgi:riboflavin kinase/FMN adenylyltransferase
MQVIRGLDGYSAAAAGAVVAIGNFDGVHAAHRQLLAAVRADARQRGAQALVLSFEPHPSRILHPEAAPPLITPGEERIRQLAALGLDRLILLPFNRDLSLDSPLEFVERVLVRGVHARAVHEGENFRFGHRHRGTIATLGRLAEEFGFALHVHPAVRVRGELVSSSRIRELVAAGDVARARWLLGRPFAVRGLVAPGRGIGRQRTVPTLNLQHYEELLPAAGVYLTLVELGGSVMAAVTNVGVRPTFGSGSPLTVESHVLHPPAAGLPAALGEILAIAFLHRLRDERRFASPELLLGQIRADIAVAERFFARLKLR